MSKYTTLEVWEMYYGKKEEVTDYAGRKILKSACNNRYSKYFPTLDHIRPLSKGGLDIIDNIVVCHRDTNEEKANSFPHWKANGSSFKAIRKKGRRGAYKIAEIE